MSWHRLGAPKTDRKSPSLSLPSPKTRRLLAPLKNKMVSVPAKWALLIGIDFYVDPEQRLEGCVNDVNDLGLWLGQKYDPINISSFLAVNTGNPAQTEPPGSPTSWPITENIAQKLRVITAEANPGDFVHVHYSGHGTLKPTVAGEYRENDGSDAALVLYDVKEGVRYLKGIDLASIFDIMIQKGLRLTVVLDCCHAGAISRNSLSIYVHIRGVKWDAVTAAKSPLTMSRIAHTSVSPKSSYRDGDHRRHWLLNPDGYILIAGCGPHEIAGECHGEDNKVHGAMSYLLLGILASDLTGNSQITYFSIYHQLRAKLHVPFPRQHPLMLGNAPGSFFTTQQEKRLERMEGGRGSDEEMSHQSFCNVVEATANDQIWLNIGFAHGVCLEDEFVIHSVQLRVGECLENQTSMNKVKVIAVYALQARTEKIQESPNNLSIRAGYYATPTLRSVLRTQIILFNGANTKLLKALGQSSWLRIVEQGKLVLTAPILQMRITEKDSISLLNGSGQEIQCLPSLTLEDEEAITQLVEILEHLAGFASIENLENHGDNSLLNGEFSVEFRSEQKAELSSKENRICVEEDSKVEVTFKNNTDLPLNLTVLNLRPLRQIKRIYPSRDRGSWKVVQPKMIHKDVKHLGKVSFKMKMSFPQEMQSTDHTEIEDVFKFFVTTRPSSFDGLELPRLVDQSSKRGPHSTSTALLDLIQRLAIGHRPSYVLRGEFSGQDERWCCCNYVISTRRRDGQ